MLFYYWKCDFVWEFQPIITENAASSSFFNGMNTLSLLPTISRQTRITDSSSTLIDNIFQESLNF